MGVADATAADGGWSWVVLLGSFVIFFINDAWALSFGVIYPDLVDYFSESRGKTAWITTLQMSVSFIVSPIICALITTSGFRPVAVIGGLIFGLSISVSAFSASVELMFISAGVLVGVSSCMICVSALMAIIVYFERRCGLALGFALIGSGLGPVIAPPVIEYLIEMYSWRGAMLLVGGIGLNIIPSGMLYRPRSSTVPTVPNASIIIPNGGKESTEHHRSEPHFQGSANYGSIDPIIVTDRTQKKPALSGDMQSDERLSDHAHSDAKSNIKTDRTGLKIKHQRIGSAICESSSTIGEDSANNNKHNRFLLLIANIFDKDVLFDHLFVIFCVGNVILFMFSFVAGLYLVDEALFLGVDKEVAVLLPSTISISRTIGQIVIGFLCDYKHVSSVLVYCFGAFIMGLSTLSVPSCTTFAHLAVSSVVFGFSFSVTFVIPMLCVIEIVYIEKAQIAFGMMQLFQGLGVLLGLPLAGYMFDALGDYNIAFYIAGSGLCLSGILMSCTKLYPFWSDTFRKTK